MARSNSKYEARDAYKAVTDQIVAALEKGVVPWVCPWDRSMGLPRNGSSNYIYKGINVWACWASGYGDPRWYTFNQVRKYASHVRKGEKGTLIVKWLFLKVEEKDAQGNKTGRTRNVPRLKVYSVFNHSQVEWADDKEPKLPETGLAIDPNVACAEAAALLTTVGIRIGNGGARAYYNKADDTVNLPPANAFKTAEGYWSTALHEATHWTGHASRCNRDMSGRFGDESYAAEELVAELGSAFLCADFGIQGSLQHPEYIGNWLTVLKGDKYAIFTASRLAREAVALLKGDKARKEGDPSNVPSGEATVVQAA